MIVSVILKAYKLSTQFQQLGRENQSGSIALKGTAIHSEVMSPWFSSCIWHALVRLVH